MELNCGSKTVPSCLYYQKGLSVLAIIFLLFTVTISIALASAGLYWAWDKGSIPGNKSALSIKAMEESVRLKIAIQEAETYNSCLTISGRMKKPERQGLPGIAYDRAPGLASKTFLLHLNDRDQAYREEQIEEFEFLANLGFYDMEKVSLQTDQGFRDAVRFSLNWTGFLAMKSAPHRQKCFSIGDRRLNKITGFSRLEDKVVGQEIWKVNYETLLINKPEWVNSDLARKMFHRISEQDRIFEHSGVLIRGADGWELEELAGLKLTRSTVEGRDQRSLNAINQRIFRITAPDLHIDQAAQMLDQYVESDKWREGTACLPMRLTHGGDDRALRNKHRRDRSEGFSANFFDIGMDHRNRSAKHLATELSVWLALEASGFAKISQLEKGSYKYGDSLLTSPGGITAILEHDAKSIFDAGRSRSCIPFGVFDIELVDVEQKKKGIAKVVAKGIAKGVPKWATVLAKKLPALKHALDYGVLIEGKAVYERVVRDADSSEGVGEWKITGLNLKYPQISYHEIPSALQPLFPLSQNNWPLIKGPVREQDLNSKRYIASLKRNKLAPSFKKQAQELSVNKQPKSSSRVRNNHFVTLKSPFAHVRGSGKMLAEYEGAGAATPWLLSKNYSSGRYYFEVEAKTTGMFVLAPHANISLSDNLKDHFGFGGLQIIRHGQHKLRSQGDIFGLAIDYDRGLFFYHVNGEWMTGFPADHSGLVFMKTKKQYPVFISTGNQQGRKGVYWKVNLGRKGFIYELPKGYKPYGF